jgi:hypothetical protein
MSPLPQPSEATTRSLIWAYLIAFIKFMGTPHRPKPPASMKDPFLIPPIASAGVLNSLEKQ